MKIHGDFSTTSVIASSIALIFKVLVLERSLHRRHGNLGTPRIQKHKSFPTTHVMAITIGLLNSTCLRASTTIISEQIWRPVFRNYRVSTVLLLLQGGESRVKLITADHTIIWGS
jgi:hypothetical protein